MIESAESIDKQMIELNDSLNDYEKATPEVVSMMFNAYDKQKNDSLSMQEFSQYLKDNKKSGVDAKKIFNSIDTD